MIFVLCDCSNRSYFFFQVIESVFQQEKEVDNMSKKALVDRGQMTAMAALKELRKISNILSEM